MAEQSGEEGLSALPPGPDPHLPVWELTLADEAAMEELARFIADELRPGDLVTLSGGLGSGKTTLARAILRALSGDPGLEAPSPTYTLMQVYETPLASVVHADFYRISGAGELLEMGWDEAIEDAITLVEWPDRAASALDPSRLEITLEIITPEEGDGRVAILVGKGAFGERVTRARALKALLERSGWSRAARTPMTGDASSRAYERLTKPDGATAVLMISPRRPDGPPIRMGRSYSDLARLAESIHAFVAVDRGLRALSLSAPRILGEDLDVGLLLLEDLGSEPVIDENGPVEERYAEAVRLLAKVHQTPLPHVLPVAEDVEHVLPPFDAQAMLIEVELFLDWYLRHVVGATATGAARAELLNAWAETLEPVLAGPKTWTLRDYHSPNLIWLPEREGIARVGVIDFQDAVIGPPSYDLVSLLQDARVDAPQALELRLLSLYLRERKAAEPEFDLPAFAGSYAIMGAQRATKICGIFARLDRRDGKPDYLRHLPRIEAYLARNLGHPALSRLRTWFETHAPRIFG
ncbi:MAG: tRNA (adenosine(37)-N6)-threonylcarbamoyltransferase complex ATPase subunit type 1 TsaE [Salinarimonadaceae bacterium]|nr:MAG: tRNA (adenosine(37)-N6)-threonylcarbamoyltransferase complex ATPase subunit type 1 TsaE [Salinarimonadaceae bacterium]